MLSKALKSILIAAATLAGLSARDASASTQRACSETKLYVVRYDGGPSRIEEYCGFESSPSFQVPLANQQVIRGFDHDKRGNLYISQDTGEKPDVGNLTAYAPDGHVIASVDDIENALGLTVDRAHGKAYVYSPRRTEEPMQGTSARYVQWSGRFAVFDLDPFAKAGFVETDQTENAEDFLVDRNGMLWIYDDSDRGLVSLRKHLPFNTCAITLGPAGYLYAISCEGLLREINTTNGAVMHQLDLRTGPVWGNGQAMLLLDSSGNVYLRNGDKNTLSCYERGKSQPVSVVSGGGEIMGVQIDTAGNVYVMRGFHPVSKLSSIEVYHGCGLHLTHTFRFGALAMTLVPATPRAK